MDDALELSVHDNEFDAELPSRMSKFNQVDPHNLYNPSWSTRKKNLEEQSVMVNHYWLKILVHIYCRSKAQSDRLVY